jgi:endonuclease YncB( thermonuclease family)
VNAKSITAVFLLAGVTLLFAAERVVVNKVESDGTLKLSWCCGIKLAGVEMPGSQVRDGRFEYFHQESLQVLRELVEGEEVTIEQVEEGWLSRGNRYYVFVDTVFVNAHLLREGCARWNGKKNHRLAEEFADYELSAKTLRKGLWINPFSMAK